MKYVGIQSQIWKNNINSVLMLLAFPMLLLGMVYLFLFFAIKKEMETTPESIFIQAVPFIILGTMIWFLVAWIFHSSIIRMATASRPLERMENKRVYNLVENLCIANGMKMPAINIIEDDSLNAFASGVNENSYAISLSRGIINYLNDDELEGVIAHELTHIRNKDVRMLMVSIIFVGIFSFIANMLFRSIRFGSLGGRGKNNGPIILIAIAISAVAYMVSLLLRFAISRSREYMADAGAAEMTRRPYALASALRKISADPLIEAVKSRDVSQLFIENPQTLEKGFSIDKVFATHPPINKRIELLEQFV
jgi:heat shock protein HtpX